MVVPAAVDLEERGMLMDYEDEVWDGRCPSQALASIAAMRFIDNLDAASVFLVKGAISFSWLLIKISKKRKKANQEGSLSHSCCAWLAPLYYELRR